MKPNRKPRKAADKARRPPGGAAGPRNTPTLAYRATQSEIEAAVPQANLASAPPLGPTLEWLFTGYFVLLVLGFVLLRLPGTMASGNEMNVDRAIFTAINTGTLTGFQLDTGINQFKPGNPTGPAAILLLTLGGAFFTLVTGGLLAVRILRLPYGDRRVVIAAGAAMGLAGIAGGAALVGGHRGPFDALLLASSAFGNSGVYTGPLPDVASWRTHLVLLPLAVLGGLGLPVLMELYDRLVRGRPVSRHSRTILHLTAVFYLGGTVLLILIRGPFWDNLLAGLTGGGWTARQGAAVRYAVMSSSAVAINSRTAGLPVEYVNVLPRAAQWIVLALMAIGGNPAGTAGGLKTTTVLQLIRGARDALAGRAAPRAFGIAASWVGAYLSIVAAAFLALLSQVPQMPADHLLFLAVSAASNVGLSHDAIALVAGPLFTLSALMILGRVLPLLILWWMAETTDGDEGVLVA